MILPLVVGLVVLIIFGFYEKRPADAVIPYRFLNSRTSMATLIGGFIHGTVLYPLLTYLPLLFQSVLLETPISYILPMCCILISVSFITGLVIDHLRRCLWQLWGSRQALVSDCSRYGIETHPRRDGVVSRAWLLLALMCNLSSRR